MNIDLSSFAFGSIVLSGGGTPSWGTSLGQSQPDYKFTYKGADNILIGMIYCSVPLNTVKMPLGKGGHIYNADEVPECQIASLFKKVYINGKRIGYPYVVVLLKEDSNSHSGRRNIKYSDKITYSSGNIFYSNGEFIKEARRILGLEEDACWFIYKIEIENQDELHMSAVIVDDKEIQEYSNSSERKTEWMKLIPETDLIDIQAPTNAENPQLSFFANRYRPYITAIKSKPFILLAGISGTGKSRIVRELARSCWAEGSEQYKAPKPKNFEIIQVKPNWHDSSELLGYVSRIKGEAEYVVGDFLKFIAKAWENWLSEERKPYFLCLDEMNLAPVEQYFAEYLSVVESRKVGEDGSIVCDPIVKNDAEGFANLVHKLAWEKQELNDEFEKKGVCLPPNLIVIGTVNMDETTFTFSRKVLDRAMTIEMNEVDLYGGLTGRYEAIGQQSIKTLVGTAVEGVDVYERYREVCDKSIDYLSKINAQLEWTPFKVAYRTRNEFLLYVVNNLPYTKDADGTERSQEYVIARALDEITSMKVLSRIEGDESKVSADFLGKLKATISEALTAVSGLKYGDKAKAGEEDSGEGVEKSVSLAKLSEMTKKLESGYTSFWS